MPQPTPQQQSNTWAALEAVLPHTRRALLYGPPGTGKTTCGIHNRRPEQPFYSFNVQEDTPVAEARGHYLPGPNGMVWKDGPCILAWRRGGRLVVNEIDRGSPEVQSFLYMISDDIESAYYTLPTGETVQPSEQFSIVATMNGEPDDLPEALQDRFPIKLLINDIHPKALERLSPELREVARSTALATEEGRRISIRTWLEFDRLRKQPDINHLFVAQAVFGNRHQEILDALDIAAIGGLLPEEQRGAWSQLR